MLTVLIRVPDGGALALGLTLEAVIPGVVRGLVGDAVVSRAPGSDPEVAAVAEAVGATLVARRGSEPGWREAAALARGRSVLLLEAGDVLIDPWIAEIERHLVAAPDRPARLRRDGLGTRLLEACRAPFVGAAFRSGLVAPREAVAAGRLPARPRSLAARLDSLDLAHPSLRPA